MDRSNPYEAAFEAYLQDRGLCYVGIDENRRAAFADVSIKNLDFIVLGQSGAKLLVDVKGRKFPGGPKGRERYVWENWSTREDVAGIDAWMNLFGPSYLGLFVFMYKLTSRVAVPPDTPDLFTHQGRSYLLRAVPVSDYRRHLRVRSPKWGTVGLPSADFQRLARPFRYYTHELPQSREFEHATDQAGDLSELLGGAVPGLADEGTEAWSRWN